MAQPPARRATSLRFLAVSGGFLVLLVTAFFVFGRPWRIAMEIQAVRGELAAERFLDAIERLERLDRRFPNDASVEFWLAVAHRRNDDLESAQKHLTEAELLGYDADEIGLQLALIESRQGNFDQVEQLLRAAIERGVSDETAAEIYEAMAAGYVASFRWRDAWQCLAFWKEWQPTAVRPRLLRAAISEQAGNREEAVADYRAALGAAPSHAEARLRLARLLLELNQVEEAFAEFQVGLRDHPDSIDMQVGVASCHRRLGQLEEARRVLDALLKARLSKSVRAEVLRIAGEVDLESSRYEEALRHFRSSEQLAPRDPRVQYDLYRVLTFLKRQDEAERHQAAFKRMSEDTQRLRRITVTLIDEPNRLDLRQEAGEILASNGFEEEAAGWWLSAVRIDPSFRPSHVALARHYGRVGNRNLETWHQRMADRAPASNNARPAETSKARPGSSSSIAEPRSDADAKDAADVSNR